jgi:hypothetical protein
MIPTFGSRQAASSFAGGALRAVGEDLDLRGIKTFAIRCEVDLIVVDGGYQSPPAATPVTLHYAPKDIEQLDCKARERCEFLSATRNFIYLSKILSSIEIYVGDKGGHLTDLSNTASTEASPVIDIEYETLQGEHLCERLTDADVYALCVRNHKRTGRERSLNGMRFTRFSALQERM